MRKLIERHVAPTVDDKLGVVTLTYDLGYDENGNAIKEQLQYDNETAEAEAPRVFKYVYGPNPPADDKKADAKEEKPEEQPAKQAEKTATKTDPGATPDTFAEADKETWQGKEPTADDIAKANPTDSGAEKAK